VYGIVSAIAKLAGITKVFSPHRIRHSIITAVLDETGGNVAKVQKLSRHKNVGTLLIYNDNRSNDQKEMSDIASRLV
jgi:integrase/recombinase XerC